MKGILLKRRTRERFLCLGADLLGGQMREVVSRGWRYLRARWYLRRHSKGFLVGFLLLLFLLASCGGGGGSGGGQGAFSVELAFTPGDRQVTVNLVEKGPLVQLLNISTYQLTAIDSANEMMRIEGSKLAEGAFNGSVLRGLTNDHNYTFALRVFYFPVGSAELSNLSLRIDYAEEANARNRRDVGGITIGSNRDGDYLADSVDADDDNDGLNDLDDGGRMLDRCPRGNLDWLSNNMTDNDGDGCRDETEDKDDDNDGVNDAIDDCQRGEVGWRSNGTTDNDGDGCRDETEDKDDDNDMLADLDEPAGCELLVDCDSDGVLDGSELPSCRQTADCDSDGERDNMDLDADGDGLIEIRTAAELDGVRWALDGSGRRLSAGGALDQTGCANGAGSEDDCHGYELVRDISLAAYADGDGWAPLGNGTYDRNIRDCHGAGFSGVFEGNGLTVRGMSINRAGEDCIGLFGHLAPGAVIRNLMVAADSVIGREGVGGLVGDGANTTILSSHLVARKVMSNYGGPVGGLAGVGSNARIVSSSSITGRVVADPGSFVGGLVGYGENAQVVSSYSVTGRVRGGSFIGGLMGRGIDAKIISSYSVAGEVIRKLGFAGGLVSDAANVDSSYWYTTVSFREDSRGEQKTLAELRMPTSDNAYDGIYANWADGADIDDTAGVEDITVYCDEDLSGAIEADERRDGSLAGEDDNRIRDFGGTEDYPAIRCAPLSLAEQRSWWFINSTNWPQLNQTRLDRLTSP